MLAGHFGLAAAVKARQPEVPLWALMVSTHLLDIVFVPLFLMGIETMEPVGEGGYGGAIINASYSHSLAGAVLISVIAALIAWRLWTRRAAVIIGSLTFSHWLLDLLVHRPDMPILPGNIGNLPLLGLRLWEWPAASMAVEGLLVLAGAVLYFRSVLARSSSLSAKGGIRLRGRAYLAGSVMAALLIICLVMDILSLN